MENITYFNEMNTGVELSTPTAINPANEAYINAQAQPEQVAMPVAVEEQKPYVLRKLGAPDLFPMIKIISKIGIDELSTVLEGNFIQNIINDVRAKDAEQTEQTEQIEQGEKKSSGDLFQIGVGIALKLANKILEHIPSCENEIYMLLGNVSGLGVEGVKALDLDVFLEMIIDFIMKDEFKNFFKVASKYIKR